MKKTDAKRICDLINLELQRRPVRVRNIDIKGAVQTSPKPRRSLRAYFEARDIARALIAGYVFEECARSLELWDSSACVRLGAHDRRAKAWIWCSITCATVGINIPNDISGDVTGEGNAHPTRPWTTRRSSTSRTAPSTTARRRSACRPRLPRTTTPALRSRAHWRGAVRHAGHGAGSVAADPCASRVGTREKQARNGYGALQTEYKRTQNGVSAKDIDIWFFHEASMSNVAMEYNRRNTTCEGAMWIYNEKNNCDTAIMIESRMATHFKIDKVIDTQHCLIVNGRERDAKTRMVSMHQPKSWQPIKELQDAMASIDEELNRLAAQDGELCHYGGRRPQHHLVDPQRQRADVAG